MHIFVLFHLFRDTMVNRKSFLVEFNQFAQFGRWSKCSFMCSVHSCSVDFHSFCMLCSIQHFTLPFLPHTHKPTNKQILCIFVCFDFSITHYILCNWLLIDLRCTISTKVVSDFMLFCLFDRNVCITVCFVYLFSCFLFFAFSLRINECSWCFFNVSFWCVVCLKFYSIFKSFRHLHLSRFESVCSSIILFFFEIVDTSISIFRKVQYFHRQLGSNPLIVLFHFDQFSLHWLNKALWNEFFKRN